MMLAFLFPWVNSIYTLPEICRYLSFSVSVSVRGMWREEGFVVCVWKEEEEEDGEDMGRGLRFVLAEGEGEVVVSG